MGELVVRVESSGGTYTDTPGQTRAIFDAVVVAGVVGKSPIFIVEGGRPAVQTIQGVRIYEQNYNVSPDVSFYSAQPLEVGMYIDTVVAPENMPEIVPDVCTWHQNRLWHRVTAWGDDAVAELVDQMRAVQSVEGEYLANLALVATNLAQRAVPDIPNDAQVQLRRQLQMP